VRKRPLSVWTVLLTLATHSIGAAEGLTLDSLILCHQIDRQVADSLPLILNANLQAGALLTPSARMSPDGQIAFGGAATRPYLGAALGMQVLPRLNLAINYQKVGSPTCWDDVATGWRDALSRTTLLKLQLLSERDFGGWTPAFSIGANDLFESGITQSFYAVGTGCFHRANLEASVGWSRGPQTGWFASAIWSPFRHHSSLLSGISLVAEWAPAPLKDLDRDFQGVSTPHRLHAGAVFRWRDLLQVSVATLGGESTYAGVALQADLGRPIQGVPKLLEKPCSSLAANLEELGILRPEVELAADLAFALKEQGLVLQGAWIRTAEEGSRELRLRVANQVYQWASDERRVLQRILCGLIPKEIESVTVVTTAFGADAQEFRWRTRDLHQWLQREINIETLAERSPASPPGRLGPSTTLYRRPLNTWQWDVQPYTESVWLKELGGSQGIYGISGGPQGYLLDHYFYRARLNITGWNGLLGCSEEQLLTPSPTVIVRSDMLLYNLQGRVNLSEAFVQRTWSSPKGLYARLSLGYYDLAFAGAALEALWYPVGSKWAVGVEVAPLLKRKYGGLGFTSKARFGDGCSMPCRRFFPYQFFLDLYGYYEPLALELKASFGQFLARDWGTRLEATRVWASGLRLTVWGSWSWLSSAEEGKAYADRGIGFSIPIDILLPKRSKGRYQYGTGAVYPDVGARVTTGIPLYRTLFDERLFQPTPCNSAL
jgi:hypothetical protein